MGKNNSSYFKKLINDYIIYVPEFQRNYLQGDDSSESIKYKRNRLLDDIFDCIKSQSKSMDLGFIYGRVEQSYKGKLFYPYDGQQRLTTLYFLYLLIYFKFKIYDEIDSIKKKLSYQTRISTNRFIESFLSWILDSKEKDNIYNDFWNKDGKDLKGFIMSQDWFMMTEWNYDVSIINMLSIIVEISGRIKENLGDKTEIVNFIDKDENNPFQFDFIYVDDISKSDDLYIKINARGKALSPFENLKSDIDEYWNNEDKTKLDAEWTEYVWNQLDVNDKNKEKSFDNSFYNLLSNIFYLQYLVGLGQNNINDKILIEIENKYKKGIVDKEWITPKLCCDSPYQMISSFLDAMTGSFKSIKDKQIESVNRKIFGLGDYQNNNGQNKIERADLFEIFVYYYSVSSLFRKNDMEFTDKRNLLNEIEIVTNRIIENQRPYLDSPTNLVKALKSVKVLIDSSIKSHGVYRFFLSIDNDTKESIRNGLMKEQVEEEILKAKLIDKDSRYVDLFDKSYKELKNKGQLGFIFYLVKNNKSLSKIGIENVSYESFEKNLNQIISIQNFIIGEFTNYELLLRAILAKAKGSFFWERRNNLLYFPLLNNDRDMSLHTFLNCYSSSNPKDVEYKFNLLDGLREVLNSFDSNKDNIEEVLKRIIEDYKIKDLEDSKKEDNKKEDPKPWYKFFVIYDGVFEQCRNGNIYFYSDKYVLLLDKKFRSGQWYEYYTFALSKALSEANKDLSITMELEPTNGKNREESVLKFKVNGIEYKCSMMNDEDRFIIKKNEKIFNLDSWNEWKEKSLKILNKEE
mgnify:FL=1